VNGVEREVDNKAVLHALAEPHRAEIVRLLVDRQLCVRDLVAQTSMAQPLVSHHLKVLREAGLVESTVCAKLTVYRMRADTLSLLAARLTAMAERAAVTSGTEPC
jgi:ArsR family transcriptional regulator